MTTTLAITLSLVVMNIFQPGNGLEISFGEYNSGEMQALTLTGFLLGLIPSNFFQAFVELNAMQVVTVSLLLGIFVVYTCKSVKKM